MASQSDQQPDLDISFESILSVLHKYNRRHPDKTAIWEPSGLKTACRPGQPSW